MNHTSVHIYDRDVDPVKIFLIKPFDPGMFDPGHLPYDDLNATLIVARRPFRLIARRPVKMLAELLGFHYLEKDNIAVNPRMKVTIESCLADSCAGLRPQPRSLRRSSGRVGERPLPSPKASGERTRSASPDRV